MVSYAQPKGCLAADQNLGRASQTTPASPCGVARWCNCCAAVTKHELHVTYTSAQHESVHSIQGMAAMVG